MNAPDSPPTQSDPGKWIRRMVVGLPVGTVILGMASFWIYFENKERKEQRTYRHALGLRRDVNEADLRRRLEVLAEAARLAPDERRQTLASYADSSLSPENMGYDVKNLTWKDGGVERSSVIASLIGSRRPSDRVLVVAGYAGDAKDDSALALLLSMAQALTGTPKIKTLQFAVIDASPGVAVASWNELGSQIRATKDRVTQLFVVGESLRESAEKWAAKNEVGVVVVHPLSSGQPPDLLKDAGALMPKINEAVDRL